MNGLCLYPDKVVLYFMTSLLIEVFPCFSEDADCMSLTKFFQIILDLQGFWSDNDQDIRIHQNHIKGKKMFLMGVSLI